MTSEHSSIKQELLRTYVEARLRNMPLLIFMLLTIGGVITLSQPVWEAGLWVAFGLGISAMGRLLYSYYLAQPQPLSESKYKIWLYIIIAHRVIIGVVLCSLVLWAWNPDFPAVNLMLVLLVALQIPLSAMSGGVVLQVFYTEQTFSCAAVAYGAWLLTSQWGHSEVMLPVAFYLLASMTFPIRVNQSMREMLKLQYGFQEATVAAQAASKAKGSFLSTMSHEIRTPLNSIIGMNALLLDSPLTAEQNKCAMAAKNAGTHLLHLINDILDFSKLEADRIELEMVDFDLLVELESAISIIGVDAHAKGIELTYEVAGGTPTYLRGDISRARQVLFNLVSNAVKFTERGSVRLVIAKHDNATDPGPNRVILRADVIDTGIGIDREKIPLLFNDFTQADTSTTRRYDGTGLGLAISKRLVELMSGAIGVESTPGVGSRFWFTLPLETPERMDLVNPVREDMASSASDDMQMTHILVAEDNPSNQLLIGMLLEKLKCTHVIVPNGKEAVDAISNGGQFDLILMDMQMPVMNGIDATIAIRALPGMKGKLPIIALTADAMNGVREHVLNAGMNDYLTKPIDVSALRKAIIHWGNIGRQQSQAAAEAPPEVNAAASVSLIDETVLNAMTEVLGEMKTSELLMEFWPTVEKQLREMRDALGAQDRQRVLALAHEMKGSAGNFGGLRISQVAAQLEKDAEDPVRAAQHIETISQVTAETQRQALAFLKSGRAA